ncbi:hypothetical protein GLAREA_06547 [Glarea lozoyensis ATCC 20868]|uniref:Uncharacterized protein n=1 Tax=Glarea lozoyensis (strain ATCC 20868 / MF5171) TaxID=1116229 RepID=S3D8Q4_GLAL2|nr:uncharacterized protein GLAREA_06547 [Glarea lozoyensis ATCC 20868]EPE33534.1 hypothetical protein GLAREA_06547 [Glarea lozoyensis ATCC 20868]
MPPRRQREPDSDDELNTNRQPGWRTGRLHAPEPEYHHDPRLSQQERQWMDTTINVEITLIRRIMDLYGHDVYLSDFLPRGVLPSYRCVLDRSNQPEGYFTAFIDLVCCDKAFNRHPELVSLAVEYSVRQRFIKLGIQQPDEMADLDTRCRAALQRGERGCAKSSCVTAADLQAIIKVWDKVAAKKNLRSMAEYRRQIGMSMTELRNYNLGQFVVVGVGLTIHDAKKNKERGIIRDRGREPTAASRPNTPQPRSISPGSAPGPVTQPRSNSPERSPRVRSSSPELGLQHRPNTPQPRSTNSPEPFEEVPHSSPQGQEQIVMPAMDAWEDWDEFEQDPMAELIKLRQDKSKAEAEIVSLNEQIEAVEAKHDKNINEIEAKLASVTAEKDVFEKELADCRREIKSLLPVPIGPIEKRRKISPTAVDVLASDKWQTTINEQANLLRLFIPFDGLSVRSLNINLNDIFKPGLSWANFQRYHEKYPANRKLNFKCLRSILKNGPNVPDCGVAECETCGYECVQVKTEDGVIWTRIVRRNLA